MTPKRTVVFPTVSAGRTGEAEARRKTAAMIPMIPRKQAFRRLNSATSRPAGSSSMKRMRPANSLTSRVVASFDLIRKTSGDPPFAGASALDFGVPLSIGRKRWGSLKFGVSLGKVEHEVLGAVKGIVVLTFVLLFAGFAIIMFLSRRFISPITHLANTMEKARGDFLDLKVDVKEQDTLAYLA